MTNYIIETQQLTRRFGQIVAVNDLDLAVPKGAVYGFLGPNGAGKTTTIRMLLGLLRGDKGMVRLFDQKLTPNRRDLLRDVGSMVEAPSLYPNLTGYENLRLYATLLNLESRDISSVLNIVQMEKAADRLVRAYSTGMRQRLGLACALLGKPRLLILDEPTNGLDPAGIQEMRHLLQGLPAASGVTIFLSSHLLNEVEQIATHIGVIKEGHLVFQGSAQQLQAELGGQAIIKADKPERARQILTDLGWQVCQSHNGTLNLVAKDALALAQANSQLVMQGINVTHLSQEKRALEEIFFSLTNNVKAAEK